MSTRTPLAPGATYLSNLRIEDFRSCAMVDVPLRPYLTILAGENNGGKSNIVEALRLVLAPADGRRVRYAELDDIRRGASERRFRVRATFSGLSPVQRGLFLTALDDVAGTTASWGMTAREERQRCRVEYWAGREGGEPEPEARELLRHVHLPALRDATRALASGAPGRVERLLSHVVDGDQERLADLVRCAREAAAGVEAHAVIQAATTAVRGTLGPLTEGVREHDAALHFAAADLRSVASDLKFMLSQSGLDLREVSESGLGYANLLYIATVMVELQRAREADLTLFLVEEPEAHLHPQLQAAVLAFLEEKAKSSAATLRDDQPAGVIQVLVTTHSPQLASAGSCRNLVVVRQQAPAAPHDGRSGQGTTGVVPIAALGLDDASLGKVDRYLDVTRSALLFSQRLLFVEGIAEALLIPVFVRKLMYPGDSAADRRARARLRGTAIVDIAGVDFNPYVQLVLTSTSDGVRIADRVLVITDADGGAGVRRSTALAEHGFGAQRLRVSVTLVTFEVALFDASFANAELMLAAARALTSPGFHAASGREFIEELKKKKVRKGELAQSLAARIEAGAPFALPGDLRTDLSWLLGGDAAPG